MNKNSHIIHLPDLLFIQYCNDQFGINRGIYNTIDSWFFEKGIINILERRQKIYHFLTNSLGDDAAKNIRKIKIGHGNLAKKLNEYFESVLTQEQDCTVQKQLAQ